METVWDLIPQISKQGIQKFVYNTPLYVLLLVLFVTQIKKEAILTFTEVDPVFIDRHSLSHI